MTIGRNRGFTIVEIALVMVIVGLLVGFGASLIKPLTDRLKRRQTGEALQAAAESIVGYVAANGRRLPDGVLFPQVARTPNDAWGRPLQYLWDSNLDRNNLNADICGRKSTAVTLRRCDDPGCTAFSDVLNVAFVVLSAGANVNNQTAVGQGIAAAATLQTYGVDLAVDNYGGDLGGARVEAYDDHLEWMTLGELRVQLDCRGPPLAVLNNELPSGEIGGAYTAAIHADGGVPFAGGGKYKWCLQTPSGASVSGLTVNVGITSDCSVPAEGSPAWTQADTVTFSGSPTTAGSFLLVAYVRDDNHTGNDPACGAAANLDNCTRKSFVVTVSP